MEMLFKMHITTLIKMLLQVMSNMEKIIIVKIQYKMNVCTDDAQHLLLPATDGAPGIVPFRSPRSHWQDHVNGIELFTINSFLGNDSNAHMSHHGQRWR